MRGKVRYILVKCSILRITPAYAGKRQNDVTKNEIDRDHPRVCGEKLLLPLERFQQRGSPPRMRGKVSCASVTFSSARITPAYAGKSDFNLDTATANRDHPRICGEKKAMITNMQADTGSPPHMRGKVKGVNAKTPNHRITPAYAGKRMQTQ